MLIKLNFLYFLFLFGGFSLQLFGQENKIQIIQDSTIQRLVEIKKTVNSMEYNTQYYAIQLYYGNYTAAKEIISGFSEKFEGIVASLVFETPNYKVRIGRFKDLNKANVVLEEIKKTYPGAFLLEPNNL